MRGFNQCLLWSVVVVLFILLTACVPSPDATPTSYPLPRSADTTSVPAYPMPATPGAVTVLTTAPYPMPATPGAVTVPTTAPYPMPVTPSAAATPTSPAPSAAVSFKQDVLPILQANCTRCHGGSSPRQGLGLETYAGAMKGSASGAVIKPKDANGSTLIQRIQTDAMPPSGTKLTKEQKQKIVDWVTAGAPDN